MRSNVRLNSTEDPRKAELNSLGRDVERLCAHIAELKVSRSDLDFELRQVKVIFYEQVGDLYVKKMLLNLAFRQLRRQVELVLEGSRSDAQIEAELKRQFAREEGEIAGLAGEQESLFEERAAVEELSQVDPELKRTLRELYLELARRFHPDLFAEPDTRARAEEVMKAINEYYSLNDLQGMLELKQHTGLELFQDLTEPIEDRIHRAQLMRARLRQAVARLEADIGELRRGQLFQIKQQIDAAEKDGTDAIAKLASQLRTEIQGIQVRDAVLRRRLASLAHSHQEKGKA